MGAFDFASLFKRESLPDTLPRPAPDEAIRGKPVEYGEPLFILLDVRDAFMPFELPDALLLPLFAGDPLAIIDPLDTELLYVGDPALGAEAGTIAFDPDRFLTGFLFGDTIFENCEGLLILPPAVL